MQEGSPEDVLVRTPARTGNANKRHKAPTMRKKTKFTAVNDEYHQGQVGEASQDGTKDPGCVVGPRVSLKKLVLDNRAKFEFSHE